MKAAFFVVGSNAARYPDLIQRIISEGHELGNHTYTHVNISEMPPAIVKLELNAPQRIIETIPGRSTILFRLPYNADRYPHSFREFKPLLFANELGYITVSESIDSEDWDESRPAVILERIKERRGEGNVVLRGNRSCPQYPLMTRGKNCSSLRLAFTFCIYLSSSSGHLC